MGLAACLVLGTTAAATVQSSPEAEVTSSMRSDTEVASSPPTEGEEVTGRQSDLAKIRWQRSKLTKSDERVTCIYAKHG